MRNYAAQSDPTRNPNFSRRWRFRKPEFALGHLSALDSQAVRVLGINTQQDCAEVLDREWNKAVNHGHANSRAY